jgi:hypothetical protein
MDEFKTKGGFVHELTPAQRAEWRKLVEPNQERWSRTSAAGGARAVGRDPEAGKNAPSAAQGAASKRPAPKAPSRGRPRPQVEVARLRPRVLLSAM